jgi:hypothetical protein
MAGASRLARLTVPANSIREAILRDVAAGVASPTIVGLVLWVLQGAKQLGLKRIYFVARDGQVMLEVARRLIKKLDFDCELRYLYGSRKAWLLPSVTKIDEEHLAGIFVGKLKLDVEFVSARLALDRLDVEPKEIQDGLASIGLCSSQDWDRNLTVEEREALTHLVLNDSVVQQVVLQKAAEARQLMVKYLEQEGLLEPIPFGMVDVGTGASLHYALSSVLDTVGQKPPVSFYLGLRGSSIEIPFGKPEAYFFDKHSNSGFFDYDTPGMNVLVELSCTADHGTVLGYKQVGDQVEPILKQQDNQAVMQWGFPIVRETMLRFSEYIYLNQELVNTRADVREACIAVENAFWSTPSSDEAQAWGSFPMEDGWGNHSHYHPLAEPYSWKDLKLPLLEGIPHGRRHWWHPGAFAMTPPLIKSTYNLCLRVGRKQKDIRIRLQLGQKLKALLRRKGR